MATLTLEQFNKKINRWAKDNPKTLKIALKKAAEIVRGEAVKNHLSGPKMARGVGSLTNATLQPHTGDLRGSINTKVQIAKDKINATVGSNMKYANRHEKGTFGMPERPYLRPSLNKERSNIDDIILDGMMGAYKKS